MFMHSSKNENEHFFFIKKYVKNSSGVTEP
jgi:hypothetical protein